MTDDDWRYVDEVMSRRVVYPYGPNGPKHGRYMTVNGEIRRVEDVHLPEEQEEEEEE